MNVIETNDLTKFYGKYKAIENLTFSVNPGEIFGFIGPNGAGKSTTIRTLLSLIYPTRGEAKIFGMDSVKFSTLIKKEIGYLPSEVFYYEHMKVIELLKYSASFYKKNCNKRIEELAEIMDLDLNKKIQELSYGSKKKVGIIQAMLHKPKLLILDEPTSGLDPLMQQNFFELLKKENMEGTTVFLSSHVLSEVQKLCHRVAIIKNGELIKLEKISTLKDNNHKKFKIQLNSNLPDNFLNIDGLTNLEKDHTSVNFLYKGNINIIIKKLSEIEISNIIIEEPDLEEIFLHYYKKEKE